MFQLQIISKEKTNNSSSCDPLVCNWSYRLGTGYSTTSQDCKTEDFIFLEISRIWLFNRIIPPIKLRSGDEVDRVISRISYYDINHSKNTQHKPFHSTPHGGSSSDS